MTSTVQFYRSNLMSALSVAMAAQREEEKKRGYTRDSAIVAGWEELYDKLKSGEATRIQVVG
jgi:hypothetical protein